MNLEAIKTVVSLIPVIVEAIKHVEAALPDGGSGKGIEKLNAVLAIVSEVGETVTQYLPTITNVIGILVKLFNNTGLFRK